MNRQLRSALLPLFLATAGTASAGVITQDGVVFTTTYTGNVLTLEIDAAGRSGGWAGATAINALGIKTVGNFNSVSMTSSTGASWSNSSSELNAAGCGGATKGKAGATNGGRLCYAGPAMSLADNMMFTFTFSGDPSLSAPHLKVRFVNDKGNKVGSLLSMDFPWQAETIPTPPGNGSQQGGGSSNGGSNGGSTTPTAPTAPTTPTAPTAPTAPTTPTIPVTPTTPDTPAAPTTPTAPITPTTPVAPTTPEAPAAPTTPATPDTSSGSGGGSANGGSNAPGGGATLPVSDPTPPVKVDEELIPKPVVTVPDQTPGQGDALPTLPVGGDESSDVPEPQSLAILGLGLAVMGMSRRRRAGRKAA